MSLKICGLGMALPEHRVTNVDLEKIMETSDEWIRTRTGIVERRISEREDTSELAVRAAQEAIAQLDSTQIATVDAVIVATLTPDTMMPSVASVVHHKLGLKEKGFFAIDVNMACTGFVGGLRMAHGCLEEGRRALVIGADVLSKIVDFGDRSTAVLFGDGAGCAVVEKQAGPMHFDGGVVYDLEVIHMTGRTVGDQGKNVDPYLHMAGQEVYRFAVTTVPETLEALSETSGIALDDVDHFVLHQANGRILQQVARRLHQPEEKFAMTLDRYGNTSASSIPIALCEMQRNGALEEGQTLFMASFGAGLQYMSCAMTW